MRIKKVIMKNFRLLKDVELSLENTTTIIVGRNNSGKTSFTELFRRLLSDNTPKFNLEDFSLSVHDDFWNAFMLMKQGKEELEIRQLLPAIEVNLTLDYDINAQDLGPLSEFIIDLDTTSTEVIINIRFQLKDGKISTLFENLEYNTATENQIQEKKNFFRVLKERVPQLYAAYLVAVDPTDETNQKCLEITKLHNLLQTGFINAQRGLDDTTHKDNDVLGKVIEKMLDIAKSANALPDETLTVTSLDNAVQDIQLKLDNEFNEHVNKLIPALSLFGYPGLNNTPLHTETILDVKRLLENHTRVRYSGLNGVSLPETYNGLGSRNLIYMLFRLFEFFKSYKSQKSAPGVHLVFIEEPEAHLHPQMQEVFIRKINEIAKDFAHRFNNGVEWPIQFIITTHSTHMANEAPFESIRYFLSTKSENLYTQIKDLSNAFAGYSLNEDKDKEFLHKYLTLTRCDLFFADKAILIEGPTERLLMPKFIEKIDAGKVNDKLLSSKYLSVIEVGGAYAHHFFAFLNFLELQTLIITDIDSIDESRKACLVSEGTSTSNACIKNWFANENTSPKELLNKPLDEKIKGFLRLAYQVPENTYAIESIRSATQEAAITSELIKPNSFSLPPNSNGIEHEINSQDAFDKSITFPGPCGRSFEDAFMLANLTEFSLVGNIGIELATSAWEKAKSVNKTDFALEYAIDKTDWNVPLYIQEGLSWLSENFMKQHVETHIESSVIEVK